jgi:uncharacterized lipoprotein YmbA
MLKRFTLLTASLLVSSLVLTACATKKPTRYYNLQAISASTVIQPLPADLSSSITMGINSVKLPSMLNRKGIVSEKTGAAVQVASHDIWAGRIKEDFTRVIAELMANNLGINDVVTEPWNTRFRPKYQLQLDVQHFSGQLGGDVRFKVNWVLSGNFGQEKLLSRIDDITLQAPDNSYQAYVSTLNTLLASFIEKSVQTDIADEIKGAED